MPMLRRHRNPCGHRFREAPSSSHGNPVQASQKSQSSAGSLSNLFYSLRMMSIAKGGSSRHLGSIVMLDWLVMLATVGLLVVSALNKRCFNARFLCRDARRSLAGWQEVLCFWKRPETLHGPTDGWCVEEPGRTAQHSSPPFHTPPGRHLWQLASTRTRLGPAIIARAVSAANHDLDVTSVTSGWQR